MNPRDVDKLSLTKEQLMGFTEYMINEMMQNKRDNWSYILQIWGVQKLMQRVPEDKFQFYWKRFQDYVMELQYMNKLHELPKTMQKAYLAAKFDFKEVLKDVEKWNVHKKA